MHTPETSDMAGAHSHLARAESELSPISIPSPGKEDKQFPDS